ncbi:MAG TPA: alanine--tRNA ligase [Caulobacteraceae bacterium]|jgi:alanyl-tRNA synthetase
MPSLSDLRTLFVDYFAQSEHRVLPSASLVPRNDPTLLFVNAGMAPLKNYFIGAETPPAPRAVTAQKCVRAGGKHNDLDNVGYTARHLTFFEMLGNFSFGDYFKEGAIDYAWRFVTQDLALPAERLIVSIHPSDEEAAALWKKIAGLGDDRIVRLEENMWSMGDTGPFGPNSEIFYDHGPDVAGGPPGSPDEDGDRFVEIWNLVFMQFEQFADGTSKPLPKPCVDTGMGLERTGAVLQGVTSVYETDLFRALIAASQQATGVKGANAQTSHQVIADHLRSSSFLIADGVTPSNEGRGYVLRRIMRRAMRHAFLLGAKEPLMHQLVPTLVAQMGAAYPELTRAQPVIVETLRQEEERFHRTLGRGMALLEEATMGLEEGDVLSGETAFRLYDTFGFPVDLTEDAVRARGLHVDMAGFETAMEGQRALARENWAGSGQQAQSGVWLSLRDRLGATQFDGYEATEGDGRLLALVKDGVEVGSAGAGETVWALFDRTPFYAESGGQAGDTGAASWADGAARVTDVRKEGGDLHAHAFEIKSGELKVGETVSLAVDACRRARTRLNHSAAHLVHAALRHVLGPHVAQKGQMVDGERMRFDFSHGGPLTPGETEAIETEVNAVIRQNLPADTRLMKPDAALEAGAVALFGEKYGDEVRVLSLGSSLDGEGAYSVELCGGTHVARTGDIALFKIISEQGIAAGIRRIEALTGEPARQWLLERAGITQKLADQFKVPAGEVATRVEALEAQRRKLEKDLADAKRQLAMGGGGQTESGPEDVGGVKFIGRVLQGVGGKDLRPIAETFRKQIGDGVVALVGVSDGKAANTIVVAGAAQSRFNAVELAKVAVGAMGGQGAGGKPDFAQGGAPDASRADAGIAAVRELIAAG